MKVMPTSKCSFDDRGSDWEKDGKLAIPGFEDGCGSRAEQNIAKIRPIKDKVVHMKLSSWSLRDASSVLNTESILVHKSDFKRTAVCQTKTTINPQSY